jgi:hypothetical protein
VVQLIQPHEDSCGNVERSGVWVFVPHPRKRGVEWWIEHFGSCHVVWNGVTSWKCSVASVHSCLTMLWP